MNHSPASPRFPISRVTPPRLTNVLLRPRLFKRLAQNQDKKLIFITGQEAQGKSTLAATYVNTRSRPAAWINVGPEESDPVNLFYLTAYALQQVFPKIDLSAVVLNPAEATSAQEELHLYRKWSHSLFHKIPAPVQVILDGLDRLVPDAPAFRCLQSLLGEAPSHVHICLISREILPLEVQTMNLKQEAGILTNEDLAFTRQETRSYLKTVRGLLLSTKVVEAIYERTEGWVGGLVLFCETLATLPERQREEYCLEVLSGKFTQEIFRYFGERAFSPYPAEIQDFLIKSSILETLEPAILQGLVDLEKAPAILEDFSRRNLFVQASFDRGKGWSYRYHQLFRDFLQTRFKTQWTREQQAATYIQAGFLYEQQGDWERAVEYLLRGQDYLRALALLAIKGLELVQTSRLGDLSRLLQALPEDLVQNNAWLLLYCFITQPSNVSWEASQTLEKAYSMFIKDGDVRGIFLTLAHLMEISVMGGRFSIALVSLIDEAENLLNVLSAEPYAYERALLMSQLGLAHFMRTGESYKGYLACHDAYVLAKSINNIPLQFNALLNVQVNLTGRGEFAAAMQFSRRVDHLLEQYPFPAPQTRHFLHLGIHYLMCGDLERAGDMIRRAQELTERHGLVSLSLVVLMQSLVLKNALGYHREAAAMGKHLLNLTKAMGNQYFREVIAIAMTIGFYQAGEYAQARKMLDQAQTVLSASESQGPHHLQMGKILSALISCRYQDRAVNEEELQEAVDYFDRGAMPYFCMSAHLTMALVRRQQGQIENTVWHLSRCFQIAKEKGYAYHLNLAKADLVQACGLVLELEVAGARDYAAHLLTRHLSDWSGPELERLTQVRNPEVARKARELQRTCHRAGVPRIYLKTLGEFQIFRGKTLIPDSDWEGFQPRLLLKAIVSRGPSKVVKDVLLEDLWPNTTQGSAERNFKVNLHRLRLALEPRQHKRFGSSYVHLRDNLIFLDQELCQVDAEEFVSCCRQVQRREQAGDAKGALSWYQKALDLYEGDFLPEALYARWAEGKREDLRHHLVDILMRAAVLYEQEGARRRAVECYQRLIKTDSMLEEAYQGLMRLYAGLGRRGAALRAFADCRQTLQRECNTEPSEVTRAIYQNILSSQPTKARLKKPE